MFYNFINQQPKIVVSSKIRIESFLKNSPGLFSFTDYVLISLLIAFLQNFQSVKTSSKIFSEQLLSDWGV